MIQPLPSQDQTSTFYERRDIVVVGAGFAGLYAIHRLRQFGFSVVCFEAGTDVGGTWYWNRYPGARCDVESLQYSYSFSPELEHEWTWTERYAAQPEILRYIEHVADRFELRRDIRFETSVVAAHFDEETARWQIRTDRGQLINCQFCILATGALSASRVPDLPGLTEFAGRTYHTGRWPHEKVDFTGQRVAVIGTGSSAIQAIPVIASEAEHLYVFQRTPNFSIPAWNRPLSDERRADWRQHAVERRALARATRSGVLYEYATRSAIDASDDEREREFSRRWEQGGANFNHAFNDILSRREANEHAAAFVRRKIREIVADPELAERLTPFDHPIGTKRICVDTDYYATYNRTNVTLVDVRNAPIAALTATGLRTTEAEFDVDSIVFATGYDAMTGPIGRIDIRGRNARKLQEKWRDGPVTYLGLMVSEFPNLFMVTGPGSPSVLSNMVVSIEQHIEWITDLIACMKAKGRLSIEATPEAEERWVDHVNAVAAGTLLPLANSWYMGANIPGKPRVFLPYAGGVGRYAEICREVAAEDYRGFNFVT